MLKQEFIKQYLFPAQKAGECFGINPIVILAQSAIETGWGESTLAKEHHNFFGITATDVQTLSGKAQRPIFLKQRPYLLMVPHLRISGRQFYGLRPSDHTAYPVAASLSPHPSAYAKEIAYSKYISEVNGDNRAAYQRMLVSICRTIERLIINHNFQLT